jgi:hypothetical protein
MPIRQKIAVIILALTIFIIILELVRRRKLKEEYSFLWLLTGFCIITLVLWYDLLVRLTHLIGAVTVTTTLFLFAFIFLILVTLQFSIAISMLTDKIKNLAQEMAIIKSKMEEKN